MAGNFGFRGLIGLSGLDLFRSFWGDAKKDKEKILNARLLTFSAAPK
jgi:hypothetical protein